MALTILECVTAACQELGLTAPATVYTATDLQTIQFGALMNRNLADLRQVNDNTDWTTLQRTFVINAEAVISTTGDVADGSAVITNIPSTASIQDDDNFVVSGADINQAARVVSVDSGTQVTISIPATGTTVGAALTFVKDTFDEPDDFDSFVTETWWDLTNHWSLLGPDSPQRMAQEVAGIVPTGPRRHFRQVGRAIKPTYRLWPALGSNETPFSLQFAYRSKFGVLDPDLVTYKQRFDDDGDFPAIADDDCFILGAKWRFMQVKGLPMASQFQAEYNEYVARRISVDGGMKTLGTDRQPASILISPSQVQDGSFPGPT